MQIGVPSKRHLRSLVLLCVALTSVFLAISRVVRSADQRVAVASKPLITITYGRDPLQVADLRVPARRGRIPVAVLIHGGCWQSDANARSGLAGFADALGKRGFATWNVEYRGIGYPGGGWPGTFQDVAAAVDKLAEIAPRYRLDMTSVTIVGHSAGAHLALWVVSRPKLPRPWSAATLRPVSVVAIDGPGALETFVGPDARSCGHPVIVPLMGGTPAEKPVEYRLASPANHLPLGLHQILIGADLKDVMRPYVAAAEASGDTVDVYDPNRAHHFDVVTRGNKYGEAVADLIAAKALVPTSAK